MCRLADALGGKAILPHIISSIPGVLQSGKMIVVDMDRNSNESWTDSFSEASAINHLHLHALAEDWHYRHAALMAISYVGEGCKKQMFPILEEVVSAVLPFIQDQHHRVQYAACNALGQMATDFAPKLQNQFHDKVLTYINTHAAFYLQLSGTLSACSYDIAFQIILALQIIPALLLILDNFNTPRVQSHAGAALVNFSEQCPKSILVGHLTAIVPKLEKALQVGLMVHITIIDISLPFLSPPPFSP